MSFRTQFSPLVPTWNGTCVRVTHECQNCTSFKDSCRRPDTHLRVFPDRIIFASMFNVTNWESLKLRNNCVTQASEVANYAASFRPGYCVSVVQDRKKTWTQNEERPSRQFAGGEWDKLAVRMKDKLITSMHPVFKGSNMLHTGALMKRKKRGVGTHFRNEPDNQSHARRNDLGVQSTLFIFRSEQ